MRAYVKVIQWDNSPSICYVNDYNHIIPFNSLIELYTLLYDGDGVHFDVDSFKSPDEFYDGIVENHTKSGLCDEKCIGNILDPITCGFAAKMQKGFLFPYSAENVALVHPDDYDKVERIVNCTLDPIYELIHELRYHPVIGIDTNIARKKRKLSGCSAYDCFGISGTVKCAEPTCHLLLCSECAEMGRIHCEDHRGHGG